MCAATAGVMLESMLDVDPEDRFGTIRPPGWCGGCGPLPAARRTSVIGGGRSIDIVKFDAA